MLIKAKKILEDYQYGKKFSLDEPSLFDKFTDNLGKKILKQPKVRNGIMAGITTAITTNDNKKAFKSAVKAFKESDMSFSKKFIMKEIVKPYNPNEIIGPGVNNGTIQLPTPEVPTFPDNSDEYNKLYKKGLAYTLGGSALVGTVAGTALALYDRKKKREEMWRKNGCKNIKDIKWKKKCELYMGRS